MLIAAKLGNGVCYVDYIRFMKQVLLFISAVLGLHAAVAQNKAPEISLQDIWASPKFMARSVRGMTPMKDGKTYVALGNDPAARVPIIVRYSFETGKPIDTLLKAESLKPSGQDKPIAFDNFSFNEDESLILLSVESEPIYRHSTREINYVYYRASNKLVAINAGKQALATFSPDGKKVAYMRDNDLYWKDMDSGKETRITTDGKVNHVLNGHTDWVYEEEFSFTKAFVWSPDNKHIAFLRFDESAVPSYTMPMYDSLYPTNYVFKYPKAGEKNATVSAHLYALDKNNIQNLNLGEFEYLPRIGWTKDNNLLWIQRTNRHQNKLDLLTVDVRNLQAKLILRDSSDTYVEVDDDLTFLPNNQGFIWSSEKTGFNHLYHHDLSGKQVRAITSGKWDVMEFLGYEPLKQTLFYLSAEVSPMERHLYSVGLNGKSKNRITKEKGTHSITFSGDYSFFIDNHSAAGQPATITMRNLQGETVRMIQDNAKLKETLAAYQLKAPEFFNFTSEQGVNLNGWMIKPANFDPNKKYPVLMYVYGGPGHNTVNDRWGGPDYMWHQMMAQKGYLVVSVDNRGTGARGVAFKKATYLQLGKLETEDQIATAKYLGSLSYVDANRIGIFGWSYGGYMSTNCITKGADVFKSAVAVAPVINWRYYDSIYTERYMRTPAENAKGYDENSPLNDVAKLKGGYLLIHGTADDNVHFQNAMMMVKSLVNQNKQFDFMAYPDKNHGIGGGLTRLQLFTKITDFFLRNL